MATTLDKEQLMPESRPNPIFPFALMFGAGLGVFNALSALVPTTQIGLGATSLLSCVGGLLSLGVYFVAGMLTTRQTGTVGAGSVCGMLTGIVAALIGGIVTLVRYVVDPNALGGLGPGGQPNPFANDPTAVYAIMGASLLCGLVFTAGLGAGLGALGGLVGQRQYRERFKAYAYGGQYMPYPYGMPYPPPPLGAYPPPPGYPATYYAPGSDPSLGPVPQPPGMYPPPPGMYASPPPVYAPPPADADAGGAALAEGQPGWGWPESAPPQG